MGGGGDIIIIIIIMIIIINGGKVGKSIVAAVQSDFSCWCCRQ